MLLALHLNCKSSLNEMLLEHKILFKFSNYILMHLKREIMTQKIHIFLKLDGFKFWTNWEDINIYKRGER